MLIPTQKTKIKGFGINVVLDGIKEDQLNILIKHLVELRVDIIRLEFALNNPKDTNILLKFLKECNRLGIKILALVTNAVPGTIKNIFFAHRTHIHPIKEIKEIAKKTENILNLYGEFFNSIEIWNEPNTYRFWAATPNAEEYVSLFYSLERIIKKYNKNINVSLGGICGNDKINFFNAIKANFFKEIVSKLNSTKYDYLSFHPYLLDNYFSWKNKVKLKEIFIKQIKNTTEYIKTLSNKPILFTEFGISTKWNFISDKDISELYINLITEVKEEKGFIFTWQLNDNPTYKLSKFSPEANFGLLDIKLNPKPLYYNLIKELGSIE